MMDWENQFLDIRVSIGVLFRPSLFLNQLSVVEPGPTYPQVKDLVITNLNRFTQFEHTIPYFPHVTEVIILQEDTADTVEELGPIGIIRIDPSTYHDNISQLSLKDFIMTDLDLAYFITKFTALKHLSMENRFMPKSPISTHLSGYVLGGFFFDIYSTAQLAIKSD